MYLTCGARLVILSVPSVATTHLLTQQENAEQERAQRRCGFRLYAALAQVGRRNLAAMGTTHSSATNEAEVVQTGCEDLGTASENAAEHSSCESPGKGIEGRSPLSARVVGAMKRCTPTLQRPPALFNGRRCQHPTPDDPWAEDNASPNRIRFAFSSRFADHFAVSTLRNKSPRSPQSPARAPTKCATPKLRRPPGKFTGSRVRHPKPEDPWASADSSPELSRSAVAAPRSGR